MLRRLPARFFLPLSIAVACGGESSDLFDSSGAPTGIAGNGGSGGQSPAITGGRAPDAGGSGGAALSPTGGRASAGASSGGSAQAGDGGSSSGGRATNGGVSPGGKAAAGENQGGGVTAGAPSTGGAGQGGTPTAGSGGSAGSASCSDPDALDFQIRGTTEGTNGSFEDECEGGDLVEYSCEIETMPGPCLASSSPGDDADLAPPIEQCRVLTGKVIETKVACDGRCRDGTCFHWCPTQTDEVIVERQGRSSVEVTLPRTDDVFQCEITYEADGVECSGFFEGETFAVLSVDCQLESLDLDVEAPGEPGVLGCSYSCSYD